MAVADAYLFPTQPAWLGFAIAIGAVAAVFLMDTAFVDLIDAGSYFLLMGMAVMASGWAGGTGPALAATVAGALVAASAGARLEVQATQAHLALFIAQGLLLTLVLSELRRARHLAEQQAQDALHARRDTEAAGRLKDEFLATISHELRTPLNAVLGWMHLLRTGKLDETTTARGLDSIERNVRLQAQLTGDLLDVSRMLTGEMRLESRPVSLTEATRLAIAAALPAAVAKRVRIDSRIPDTALPVLGDSARLRQIVWHLLANAIKFSPRGGTVGLEIEARNDSADIIVSDNGPGISPEFLPRIFDPFTQEDPSATRAAGGLGVGLFLVRDLVELHGGEVRAHNKVPGTDAGAVFVASFPLHAGSPEVLTPASTHPRRVHPALEGLRVLVLDQDADARELLGTVLQRDGALVRTAASVAEALESLESWRPDVLVSDSATPRRESYTVIGKVPSLESDRGGRIPAAALTMFGRTDREVRSMLDACQREVPKPVEPALLTAEVARLAGRQPSATTRTR